MLNMGFVTGGNKKLIVNDATAIMVDGFYRLLVLFQNVHAEKYWLIHEHKWTPVDCGYSAPAGLVNMINKVGEAKVINSKYWRFYREVKDCDLMPDSEFTNYSYEYNKYMDEADRLHWEVERDREYNGFDVGEGPSEERRFKANMIAAERARKFFR